MVIEENKIRSVQFIDSYFPVIDGVIETVHNYALNMDAAVVCPRMTRPYDTTQLPYPVHACPALRIPHSQLAIDMPFCDPKLTEKLEAFHPDIFHVHSPAMLGDLALQAGHRLGIPVVATFHSKIYDAVKEFTGSRGLAKAASRRTVKFYEKCDAVWACSEGTAETLRSYGFHGEISVMTNGTDITLPGDPEKSKAAAAERFGLPTDRHILLFVGQMVWYKNIRLILDTFRQLLRESDNYCLVLAGAGRDDSAIERCASELGLPADRVIRTGKISDRTLLTGLYLAANLFFFPSVFDNTPLVMREAAALGLPSLVTENSNAAEAIQKDINGFTAPPDASAMCAEIQRIFKDPALLRAAGEAARETIPISWKSLIPQVQSRYREILERSRS